jgi:apolipoprotein N-acyltransferase
LPDAFSYWSRWYYLLAFLAGSALTLAFAPFELRPIAWLSPALLFFALHKASTRKQFILLSYCFGIGMFATGASWIFYPMHFFSRASIPLAGGLTAIFVLAMALFLMVFGWLASFFRTMPALPKLLFFFPACWVLGEWFRSWFLTGFPWLFLGHSQIDSWLVNIAPIGGTLAVSWFSALISAALVLLITGRNKDRLIATSLISTVLLISFMLGMINWTQPTGAPLKVSLLQGNIAQEKKWLPETLEPTIQLYLDMTRESWESDLVIWPETAIPGYYSHHVEDLLDPLQEEAYQYGTDLLIGGFYYNREGIPGSENSIISLTTTGREIYSKRHLVPFSEYIPLLKYFKWLNEWIQLPYDNVKRGTGPTNLKVAGQMARMSVCYEDAYGEEIIEGLPEATLLVNVSNDGWFTGSIEPQQHMEIARMRSVETGRYTLRSTNIGISGIIDQRGKIISTAPAYETRNITGMAQPYSGSTPYIHFANWPVIILMSLVLMAGIRSRYPVEN